MAVNPQQRYLEIQIQTATPEKLVTMLYDGAIRFMSQAKLHIQNSDFEQANNSLIRAQDIFTELRATLNMDAGEIAANLDALYEFMINTLVEANIKKDQSKIDDVIGLVTDLRDTWNQATSGFVRQDSPSGDRLSIVEAGR